MGEVTNEIAIVDNVENEEIDESEKEGRKQDLNSNTI